MPTSASNNPTAALICVGSELLRGKLNTHASTLAQRLASVGIALAHEESLPDDQAALTEAIRRAIHRFPLIIVTGGLGPTFDDLTREAAAAACGRSLVLSKPLLSGIRAKFRRARYRRMPPANERQAYLIEGATAIPNANGTAPGQWLEAATTVGVGAEEDLLIKTTIAPTPTAPASLLILLPGPPRELNPMLEQVVLPRLKKTFRTQPQAEAHLHFVGIPESKADQAIRPIIAREPGVDFTILAHLGLVDLDVFVRAARLSQARARCERIVRRVLKKLGRYYYGRDAAYPLEKVVGDALRKKRATVALAESCSGGMLAARLTDIPGSSDYLLGGIVSYANRIKEEALGVDPSLLRKYGAVSAPVAQAMAEGARQRFGSTYAVGISGIAGPGGGTLAKPVGLVYISVAGPRRAQVREYRFGGNRETVRERSVVMALNQLRLSVVNPKP